MARQKRHRVLETRPHAVMEAAFSWRLTLKRICRAEDDSGGCRSMIPFHSDHPWSERGRSAVELLFDRILLDYRLQQLEALEEKPTRSIAQLYPSHSTASPWTASAGSKAMMTHGPSGRWWRKSPVSHRSINQWAAAIVSRHARCGPTPPPSATANSAMGCSSGATMCAFRTRGPCGCASTCSRQGSSGSRNGAGVASAPATATSRP